MVTGQKTTSPDVEAPETKENGTMSGPLVTERVTSGQDHRKPGMSLVKSDVVLRLLCMATSVTAMLFMVTARQASTVTIYGFPLPVYSKWSFSDSFEYLVGVSLAVAAHSLLQLLISSSRLIKKSPVIPSRNHAWLVFAGDQVFAYAMISAGSAASGVSNLNRTGIRHISLPNFCKSLNSFCDHVAISIAFTFFTFFLLAVSAIQDVIWLSMN